MADIQTIIGSITLGSILAFFLSLTVIILVAYFCYKAAKAILLRYTSRSVARWAARIAGYLVFAALFYTVDLWILGLDLNATIASLGIISIAIAFASQQIIANLLAGILIAINRPVRLDDWVELGGDPDTGLAQVRDMTFTRTVLQDRDGRVFLVPNATLLSSKIVNFSRSGFIEVPVDITLPLSVPFDRAKVVILDILSRHPDVLPKGFSSSSPMPNGIRSSYFFQGYTGKKTIKPGMFSPRVLLTGITHQAISISIRFWIADVTRREDIISVILDEAGKKLELSAGNSPARCD
jgi:small-conductance mechanosensitive channel